VTVLLGLMLVPGVAELVLGDGLGGVLGLLDGLFDVEGLVDGLFDTDGLVLGDLVGQLQGGP